MLSTGFAATIMPEAIAGAAATEKLPAQVCASGAGACETPQQLSLAPETVTDGFSACSIPIRSQFACVCGVAHSLGCECTSAQTETGNDPRPANPRATKTLRIRRIFI